MTAALAKLDVNFAIADVQTPLDWYDLAELPTEGQGWPGQTVGRYARLPAHAQGVVPDSVWYLGQMSAGLSIRFVTDAPTLAASWDITGANVAMNHMPATGVSGLDLYVRSEGRWRWASVTRPDGHEGNRTFTQFLLQDLPVESREYRLYLPLYNSVGAVRLGVTPGHTIQPAEGLASGQSRPVCFYGTSILQGGCASRPGMAYPSIIARQLGLPHLNLGFSGSARSEIELAHLLAELDPCLYVLDPLPNMEAPQIVERTIPFIQTLRQRRPDTPIVMVESVTYQQAHLVPARHARYTQSNAAWRNQYETLLAQGVANLHYIPGDDLFGHDDEATVDGTHATDVGFLRMAQVIGPVIKRILNA